MSLMTVGGEVVKGEGTAGVSLQGVDRSEG